MAWFAVRCIFELVADGAHVYEERITLWSATNFEEAIAQAESEAAEYAVDGIEYLGLAQCYRPFDDPVHGSEVFSLIRANDLPPEDYLSSFFDTGSELQRTVDGDPPP